MAATKPLALQTLANLDAYRKENPLPSGWSEAGGGEEDAWPTILLQNERYFLEVRLSEADTDYGQPGEFNAFLLRKDRTPPSFSEAKELIHRLLGPATRVHMGDYAAIDGWENERPLDYVWDGGPDESPNEHHALQVNCFCAVAGD